MRSNRPAGLMLWAWRSVLAAALGWSVLAFSWIAVAVLAVWFATEAFG